MQWLRKGETRAPQEQTSPSQDAALLLAHFLPISLCFNTQSHLEDHLRKGDFVLTEARLTEAIATPSFCML